MTGRTLTYEQRVVESDDRFLADTILDMLAVRCDGDSVEMRDVWERARADVDRLLEPAAAPAPPARAD